MTLNIYEISFFFGNFLSFEIIGGGNGMLEGKFTMMYF